MANALLMRWTAAGGAARSRLREVAIAIALGCATALLVGYSVLPLALLIAAAAGLMLALAVGGSLTLAGALLGASIPLVQDLTGGHLGLNIAASDVLLVLIGARLLFEGIVRERIPALRALRPLRLPLAQYLWFIGLLLLIHLHSASGLFKSVQRVELFALPVLVGAYLALQGRQMVVLRAYVIVATLLSVVWPVLNAHGLNGQLNKNPTGGFIASAILLVLAVQGLRRFQWCVPILLFGVAITASRGAILALGVGTVVTLVMQASSTGRGVLLMRALAIAATAVVVYQFLPSEVTNRLGNYSAGTQSRSSYALLIRQGYDQEAEQLIARHRWTGVGVGEYYAGSNLEGTATTDPHNVILLEAAEGGYLFAASFILLVGGVLIVLWRYRRSELAAAAAAVLTATLAHGMVDVYWVRGTPVLGWLLVGMVCGLVAQQRAAAREAL